MEEKKRDEVLENIQELAKNYPGDLLISDVTLTEKNGTSKGVIGLAAVAVTAIIGGTAFATKKIRARKAKKEAELKEKIRKEILDELVVECDNEHLEEDHSSENKK